MITEVDKTTETEVGRIEGVSAWLLIWCEFFSFDVLVKVVVNVIVGCSKCFMILNLSLSTFHI